MRWKCQLQSPSFQLPCCEASEPLAGPGSLPLDFPEAFINFPLLNSVHRTRDTGISQSGPALRTKGGFGNMGSPSMTRCCQACWGGRQATGSSGRARRWVPVAAGMWLAWPKGKREGGEILQLESLHGEAWGPWEVRRW